MTLLVFPLALFGLGLVFAIVDWIAVVIEHKPLEYVASRLRCWLSLPEQGS